ncbi:MAG: hypothetical protein B2I17_04995 [Thermoplasmatales archaeon B_DKE]|nr:MAG: hypothetical protein B2I17_04995 [Thermoplasmatales archaeon B_DKE]
MKLPLDFSINSIWVFSQAWNVYTGNPAKVDKRRKRHVREVKASSKSIKREERVEKKSGKGAG